MAYDQIVVDPDETAAERFARDYDAAYDLVDDAKTFTAPESTVAERVFDTPHTREDNELNHQTAERLGRLYVVKPAGTTPADDNRIV
jgi:hypothetical protein